MIVVVIAIALLVVPYINQLQEEAEQREKIASLINLQKILAHYKASNNSLQYPKDLSIVKVNNKGFKYYTSDDKKQYVASIKIDFDNDGKEDDYLYVTSAQFGVEKKLDANQQPTLPSAK